jgi:hypothetical protein
MLLARCVLKERIRERERGARRVPPLILLGEGAVVVPVPSGDDTACSAESWAFVSVVASGVAGEPS